MNLKEPKEGINDSDLVINLSHNISLCSCSALLCSAAGLIDVPQCNFFLGTGAGSNPNDHCDWLL